MAKETSSSCSGQHATCPQSARSIIPNIPSEHSKNWEFKYQMKHETFIELSSTVSLDVAANVRLSVSAQSLYLLSNIGKYMPKTKAPQPKRPSFQYLAVHVPAGSTGTNPEF
jgi:hypothetical protein